MRKRPNNDISLLVIILIIFLTMMFAVLSSSNGWLHFKTKSEDNYINATLYGESYTGKWLIYDETGNRWELSKNIDLRLSDKIILKINNNGTKVTNDDILKDVFIVAREFDYSA